MLIQCCVCKKFRHEGRWGTAATIVNHDGRISHSYCPECARRAFEELQAARGGDTSAHDPASRPFAVARRAV